MAEYTVTITIAGLPATPLTDTIYMAGTFNNWNAQDENFRLQQNAAAIFFIEYKEDATAAYEFKFTRGSWNKAETDGNGGDLPNRVLTITANSSIQLTIAGWKDGFVQKTSAASARVSIIDTAFPMPQLNRTRRIWIYLPLNYNVTAKRYPVLYMHDGQNLFDNATSYAGEWGIDEFMDSISNACIVVGIDNGGLQRMTEYNPNDTKQFGKAEGGAYLSFIVNTLKLFIDNNYNTLPDKAHTYMAGSSMGGLISFYAGLYYPKVFAVLGIFSPSFWIAPQVKTQLQQLAQKEEQGTQKYYFYAGGAEERQMAAGMETVAALLKKIAGPQLRTVVNPAGMHNEKSWGDAFAGFYQWINEAGN